MDGVLNVVPESVKVWTQDHPYIVVTGVTLCVLGVSHKLLRRHIAGGRCTSRAKLQGKTVLITGANCGIGLETARDLAGRGARVLIACRNVSAGNDAAADIRRTTGNGNVEVYELDLSSLQSVRECASELLNREDRIHILINNAGVMLAPSDAKTKDGFELQMGTNHLGHFLLTNLLLDRIKQSAPARIINVSSKAHRKGVLDVNDILSPGDLSHVQIYGRSKLANILFTNELHQRLKGSGVSVYSLHPGVIKTNLTRYLNGILQVIASAVYWLGILKTPVEGAQTSIYCAVQEGLEEQSGKYFSDCAVKETANPLALDDDLAKKLWDKSAAVVGL